MKQGLKLAMTSRPSSSIISGSVWRAVPSFFCQRLERAHPSGEGRDVWEWQQLLVAGKSTLASFGDGENNRMT